MKKAERHLNQGKDFIIFSDDKRNVGILAHNGCQSVAQTKFAHGQLPKNFCPKFILLNKTIKLLKGLMPKEICPIYCIAMPTALYFNSKPKFTISTFHFARRAGFFTDFMESH